MDLVVWLFSSTTVLRSATLFEWSITSQIKLRNTHFPGGAQTCTITEIKLSISFYCVDVFFTSSIVFLYYYYIICRIFVIISAFISSLRPVLCINFQNVSVNEQLFLSPLQPIHYLTAQISSEEMSHSIISHLQDIWRKTSVRGLSDSTF